MTGLIIDDNRITRKLVKRVLSKYADTEVAKNGNEGIELFKSSIDKGIFFDFICLDISMPEKDGYEVIYEIREIEKDKNLERTTIIVMSALGSSENINEGYKKGADYYLVKPFQKADIEPILERIEIEKE